MDSTDPHSEKHTGTRATKKWAVVQYKLHNPQATLKFIAEKLSVNYDYTRHIWSDYIRSRLTQKGEPLSPILFKPYFLWQQVPPGWYERLGLEASVNRNRQKVWRGRRVSVVVHVEGQVYVYPYFQGWREELEGFFVGWLGGEMGRYLLKELKPFGREVAVHAPGVPRKVTLRVRGLGTVKTDGTPYPDGTLEYEVDPLFDRRLRRVEELSERSAGRQEDMLRAVEALASNVEALSLNVEKLNQGLVKLTQLLLGAVEAPGKPPPNEFKPL